MATHRLDIDAPIGFFDITSEQINHWFDKNVSDGDTLNVHINSPGGDVFDGIAIFNRLDQHDGAVNVTVDGLAASAASLIAMAGDSIKMAKGAFMMIHEPWGLTIGDAKDHQKTADNLKQIAGEIVDIYHQRTGVDRDEVAAMVSEETWMTGADARAKGFADDEQQEDAVVASFDLSKFRNVPKGFAAQCGAQRRKEPPMTKEIFAKAAAENPDWVAEYREQGIKAGKADGRTEARDEYTAMLAAAGGDHKLAGESFAKGLPVETVEAVAADRAARAEADDEPADQSVGTAAELAQLRAQVAKLTEGEEPVVVDGAAGIKGEKPGTDDPRALAEWEYDNDQAVFKASSKERYVNSRVSELKGALKVKS